MSSADLANNLGNVSAVLSVTGTTYEETLGMLTAITEQTRNASKASRGLVQISSRLTQVLDDSSKTGAKLKDIYSGLGIELMDSNGQIRSTYDILEDLSKQWDGLTKNEKEYIALTSAGSNQVQNFMALMNGFSQAIDATTTAYESSGSAAKENEKAMDTIGKKAELLRSQFEQLILGEGGLQSFAKGLLDAGIAMLKFANSDIGQAIIKITLWTAGINGAFKALELLKGSQIINWISTFITAMTAAKDSTIGFVGALELANINPIVLAITALVGVVIAAKVAYDHFNVTLEEHVEKLKELQSDYEEAQTKADELERQLENVRDRIEEINSKDNLELTDETQLRMLQEEEASLENQLLVQKELARIAKEKATDEAKQTLQKETTDAGAFGSTQVTVASGYTGDTVRELANKGTVVEALDSYVKQLNETQDEIDSLLIKRAELEKSNQKESEEYKQINSDIDALRTKKEALRETTASYAETVSLATQGVNEEDEVIQGAINSLTSYTETLQRLDGEEQDVKTTTDETTESTKSYDEATSEIIDSIEKLVSSLGLTNSQLERYSSLMGDIELENFLQNLQDIRDASNDASTGIDNLQSALETAVEAQAEYESNGKLTLDTFQSLMGISADYLIALENENGQIEINQTTLGNLVETMKAAKIEELQQAAAADILAYSQGNMAEVSDFAKGLVADLGNNIETTGEQAKASALKMNTFSLSVGEAITAMGGTVKWSDNGQRAILQGYKDIAKQVAELTIDTTTYGNTSSKAHNKSASSTKSEKSALDQLKDKYKDVINFILDGYDKQIDKLEDARDAEIDRIEAEIDALEKERDARKEYWDGQLDALEKNNDATEDAITLQEKLNALATAQQTKQMVFKDGRFRYSSDEEAVSSAQSDIDEFNREQEYKKQKELLEQLRDAELDNYDKRLEDLESFKEERQKYYEEQIEDLKAQKEATKELLENGVKDQKEYEDKMLAQLGNFVADWNATVGAMSFPDISGSGIDVGSISVSQTSSGGSSTKTTKTTTTTKPKTTTTSKSTKSKDKNIHVKGGRIMAYASGTNSIKDNEIALVGDNPKYRELVIGSKLNNDQGSLMRLSSGSGVVNADSTKTLASIFNSLSGQINSAPFANNGVNNGTTISIGSISLPEVKDGQGFVDYMQHFSTDITQQSFNRV